MKHEIERYLPFPTLIYRALTHESKRLGTKVSELIRRILDAHIYTEYDKRDRKAKKEYENGKDKDNQFK